MYKKIQFGLELKTILKETNDVAEIGRWAFSIYWKHITNLENEVRAIALTLNTMADGLEFAFTLDELEKIANDLIAGKEAHNLG